MAGFDNEVMYAANVRFDGSKFPGQVTTDGQLLIGATVAPNIRVGTLTSTGGTLTITPGAGTINLDLAGGSVGADSFGVQAFTAPGTNPVVPTGAGLVTINGASVAASTIPVRSNSIAANTLQIEVQRAAAFVGSSATNAGLCSFSSAGFSVDANGFVTNLAAAMTWLDTAGGALAANTGYFVTAAAAVTLPLTPAQGTIVEIVDQIGGGVVVTAAGANIIQVQNVASSAGGTATSTQKGDALRLVFRTADLTWYVCPGAGGNWILA